MHKWVSLPKGNLPVVLRDHAGLCNEVTMSFFVGFIVALLVVWFVVMFFFTCLGGKDEDLYHPRLWWPLVAIGLILWFTFR